MVYKIELKYRFKQKAKSEALVRTFKNSLKLSLLSLRSLEYLNWPAKNLKKHFISMICTPEPTIVMRHWSAGNLLWQLSIVHNIGCPISS